MIFVFIRGGDEATWLRSPGGLVCHRFVMIHIVKLESHRSDKSCESDAVVVCINAGVSVKVAYYR